MPRLDLGPQAALIQSLYNKLDAYAEQLRETMLRDRSEAAGLSIGFAVGMLVGIGLTDDEIHDTLRQWTVAGIQAARARAGDAS